MSYLARRKPRTCSKSPSTRRSWTFPDAGEHRAPAAVRRARIGNAEELGITCSIGVTWSVAKNSIGCGQTAGSYRVVYPGSEGRFSPARPQPQRCRQRGQALKGYGIRELGKCVTRRRKRAAPHLRKKRRMMRGSRAPRQLDHRSGRRRSSVSHEVTFSISRTERISKPVRTRLESRR